MKLNNLHKNLILFIIIAVVVGLHLLSSWFKWDTYLHFLQVVGDVFMALLGVYIFHPNKLKV